MSAQQHVVESHETHIVEHVRKNKTKKTPKIVNGFRADVQ